MDREQQRERQRIRSRQWRQSMSELQRHQNLARRRANYQEQRREVGVQPCDNTGMNGVDSIQQPNPHQIVQCQADLLHMNTAHCDERGDSNRSSYPQVRVTRRGHLNCRISIEQPSPHQTVQYQANFSHINTAHRDERGYSNRSSNPQVRVNRRGHHNCARDYHEVVGVPRFCLPAPTTCQHCNARLFSHETSHICCLNGKTKLPLITSPPEMFHLFCDQTAVGRHFRQNIRSYNHIFTFTSMGVQVDESLANGRQGVYTFRAQGAIYHRIGSLLPTTNDRPRYLQVYIYDTEHELDNRMSQNEVLDRNLVEKIQGVLDDHNPFVHTFRFLSRRQDLPNCRLIIREQAMDRRQYTLPSASQVAAIIVGGEEVGNRHARDIIVETIGGNLLKVPDSAGYYDPLQYPLFMPYGTYGWDINTRTIDDKKVTCREFYAYIFQIRPNNSSTFLRGGRLLQQYVVDIYVKIETNNLRWIRSHQEVIRAELYQGLQDSLNAGENSAGNVGRKIILPSSFVGSPRDMYQRYQDAMALVQKYGKPDLFLTMTCNPSWDEIKNELLPGQSPQDRPDLVSRVFRAKFEEFKEDIIVKGVLGKVLAYVYVIEFQKRGLPHAHMLIILDENDKLSGPEDYDSIVRAEIPNKEEEPEIYNRVLKHMIHGPCGRHNSESPCMKNGVCKRNYPKKFSPITIQGEDSYPIYRRRDTGPVFLNDRGRLMVDSSWVVPYNPWLLLKYDCHINVEICSSVKSVKYLYKYVYKGPDRVLLEVQPTRVSDEIRNFVDARWVCAHEAFWKILMYQMNRIYPAVARLQIHLPDCQSVRFSSDQTIREVLSNDRNSMTMLTGFFTKNSLDTGAREYLYREFPEHYRWNAAQKTWMRRLSQQKVIGRIYTVSPSEGERFYLRVLLNHVKGPMSFGDLLTVNGISYQTFKQSAEKRGLLEEDDSIRQCLLEASNINMPRVLRRLFVTILVYCEPTGVRRLWDEFNHFMAEDYPSSSTMPTASITNQLLHDINGLLLQHHKKITDFDLPRISGELHLCPGIPKIIEDELSTITPPEDLLAVNNLNDDQRYAFDSIMSVIRRQEGQLFFVDGPGGTGKTFLYRALLAKLRSEGHIVLATATSGIAATILPGGRTAHSRFKIPINPDAASTCSISKQSDLAELIRRAKAIIWDEATMAHRHAFEAVDRTFKDITELDIAFGGKVMIFGGDFRQVLPVVPKGTRSETIAASLVKASFWTQVQVLRLKENMRSRTDREFSKFLLRVGDGEEVTVPEDMIRIPSSMVIPWEGDESLNCVINEVFPNLCDHVEDSKYMTERALITPLNEDVDYLNERIINMFPGIKDMLYSFDSVQDDHLNLYQQEYLNSISPGGMPPHVLALKKGAPIMLLRNIDPKMGLCNGSRLVCRGFYNNLIDAEILLGQFAGTRVFLPRIPLKTAENIKLPFVMTRKQFPIKLSFALTINKSQGQTIPHVGIYLPEHVFGHGQLYVALSRGVSMGTTKVLVKKGEIHEENGVFTKNVVYPEVLLKNTNSV